MNKPGFQFLLIPIPSTEEQKFPRTLASTQKTQKSFNPKNPESFNPKRQSNKTQKTIKKNTEKKSNKIRNRTETTREERRERRRRKDNQLQKKSKPSLRPKPPTSVADSSRRSSSLESHESPPIEGFEEEEKKREREFRSDRPPPPQIGPASTEDYASDGDAPPKKTAKKDSGDESDGDDIIVCETSKNRRVSVRNWQGKVVVDIREFCTKLQCLWYSHLVDIWEQRKFFGSRGQNLKDLMLGMDPPPPVCNGNSSNAVKIMKRDAHSLRVKMAVGGMPEKIMTAFLSVHDENINEEESINRCRAVGGLVGEMMKDAENESTQGGQHQSSLVLEIQEQESVLEQSIQQLENAEAARSSLVSQLNDALNEQEMKLADIRAQLQGITKIGVHMITEIVDATVHTNSCTNGLLEPGYMPPSIIINWFPFLPYAGYGSFKSSCKKFIFDDRLMYALCGHTST